MAAIETIERAGFVARIFYDEDASGPDDWDTFGKLAFNGHRIALHGSDLPGIVDQCDSAFPCDACDGYGTSEEGEGGTCDVCKGSGAHGEALAKRMHGAIAVLPVYAYDDRMGTVVEVADDWTRANGWIYATQESVDMTGVPADAYLAALESELAAWNQYLQGDVYGVVVTDPRGEEIDSCWGFYGFDYAMEEARGMLDSEPGVALIEANPAMQNLIIN